LYNTGYIIIIEKLQSYAKLLGIAILCSLLNMACLAVYRQILITEAILVIFLCDTQNKYGMCPEANLAILDNIVITYIRYK
jgi:hypothetical protein